MKFRSLVVGCLATLFVALGVHAQSTRPEAAQTAPTAGPTPGGSFSSSPADAGAPGSTHMRQPRSASAASTPAISADAQRAFLNQDRMACHSEKMKAAGLDSARRLTMDALDPANVDKDREKWELVVRKVRAGQMPPLGMKRPEPAEFGAIVASFENELDRTAKPFTPPPGLHRLNRTEYANVVRDLLDLDVDAAKYLPSDDSTSGFDNIAGALGISSTQVEAYVGAAQKISRLALGYPEEPTLVVYRTREDTSQEYHVEGLPFGTRGGMLVPHTFPSDGEYTITVTPIFGDNMSPTGFGSVPCERIEMLLDGKRLSIQNWQGGGRNTPTNCAGRPGAACRRRRTGGAPATAAAAGFGFGRNAPPMRVRFKTTAGTHMVGATFPATNLAPGLDLDKHFQRSTVQTGPTPGYTFFPHVGTIRIEGPFDATQAKDSPSRRKVFVCTPKAAAEETACARRIVTNLATYGFRRPATAADVNMLMEFYDFGRKEKDFDQGIEMVLARVLSSPQFIYRIEEQLVGSRPGQAYRISDVDLASRLSFFLWSSAPDEELLKLAAAGRLNEPVMLERQVRRMLKHPKAGALADNFAGQWLNLRALDVTTPLPLLYPNFDDPLREAMRKEVELLFDTIVREDRSVVDILNADYTFVNERLARHYGIKNITGSQFRRVTLGPDMEARRGLLGKGAFLATSSKPDRTSPVTRGKWIMGNILGMSPPNPPPDVPPLPPRAGDPNAKEPTMRKKMEDHRVRPDCVQCHRLMDPIGFALENFDATGSWRTQDEGTPVNTETQLFDNTKVGTPVELGSWLSKNYSNQFVTVASEKMLTYALGRGVEYRDMPLVRQIARDVVADNGRFSSMVLGIVKSRPFQMNTVTEQPAPASSTARANTETRGVN